MPNRVCRPARLVSSTCRRCSRSRLASVLTAPLGARIAHTLDRRPMQRIFAVLLFLLAAYMAYKGYKGYKAY